MTAGAVVARAELRMHGRQWALLRDPEVARWYDSMNSPVTARHYLMDLDRLCRELDTTPAVRWPWTQWSATTP